MQIAGSIGVSLAIAMVGLAPAIQAQTPLHFGWSSVTPHTADYDGNGRGELGLYDSTKGTMYARKINGEELAFDVTIALPGFLVACADFDGDGKADPASYDLTNGVLYAYLSGQDYQLGELPCVVGASTTRARPADFDGDGKADFALYDSNLGLWVVYPSASGYQPVAFYHMAGAECQAVPADFDGDGKADPAVYDAASGLWAATFSGSGYAMQGLVYGGPGCAAAPADFDGDGKADPAVYCAGLGVWGTLNSSSNYAQNLIIQGGPSCVPVPGNYYFTNRADYAVYNATNGCWYIAYQPVGGILSGLGSTFFSGMINGAGREVGSKIMGWSLKKIFHHGEDPTDPHWAEEQQTLSEMNQKLDELLYDQQVITNMLVQLSQQLEYDKNQIEWFIKQSAADNAITIIESHYDQHGIDGYRSFYECDTNNPPACGDVDFFANVVLGSTYNMKTAVDNIYRAVLPVTGTSNGVLRLWAAMAKPTLTPDNLLDNFTALAYYFSTMYNYQMKGAVIYVDASRVRGTSEWAKAATAAYITNDLANMIQAEVDEFRAVTYDYIMTAIGASYNPLGTSNALAVANVAETLAPLEFFSHQWLAQPQHLCGTMLTVDRPSVIAKYGGITAYPAGAGGQARPAQAVATNRLTGHAYGYLNPDLKHLVAINGYVFLRNDFGQVPPGVYSFSNSFGYFGAATVSNYDENMQPPGDPAVTNWFGHLYASPFNYERLLLPVADSGQWTSWTPSYYHYVDQWHNTHINDYWPTSLANFSLGMELQYNWEHGTHLPNGFGGYIFTYAAYPVQVINGVPGGVQVRMDFCANNTKVVCNYDADDTHEQRYSFDQSGGRALLALPATTNIYTWLTESGSWTEPKWVFPFSDYHSWTNACEQGKLTAALPAAGGQTSAVTVAIGADVQPWLDCFMGKQGFDREHTLLNQVSFSISYVILSFY